MFVASFAAAQTQSTETGRDEPRPQQLQDETSPPVYVARTDSPRATLSSFLRLRAQFEEAARTYWEKHDRSNAERALLIADEFTSLIDLSEVPAASRREVGIETGGYLLDIFGRIPLPNLDDVPDVTDLGADGPAAYAIPDTPFRIVRIDGGPRAGEFLFSSRTIQSAPQLYRALANRPLKTSLPIESWTSTFRELTGPLIPARLIAAVPGRAEKPGSRDADLEDSPGFDDHAAGDRGVGLMASADRVRRTGEPARPVLAAHAERALLDRGAARAGGFCL